jgi:hypothetical protein
MGERAGIKNEDPVTFSVAGLGLPIEIEGENLIATYRFRSRPASRILSAPPKKLIWSFEGAAKAAETAHASVQG